MRWSILVLVVATGCSASGADGSSGSGASGSGSSGDGGSTSEGGASDGGTGATSSAGGGGSGGCADAACDASCGGPGQRCCAHAGGACDTATLACASGTCASCISAVDIGGDHACVIRSDGSVWCWGYNGYDQVARNGSDHQPSPTPVLAAPPNATELHLADYKTCVRGGDGKLACWGYHWYETSLLDEQFPMGQPGLGVNHTCVLPSSGQVWCWGNGDSGQLGNGLFADYDDPVHVASLGTDNLAIHSNVDANCVIKTNGSAWCWGSNHDGQLGIGNSDDQPTPVELSSLGNDVTAISLTGSTGCALRSDGSVACWGVLPLTPSPFTSPQSIVGLPGPASHLAVGRWHACAIHAADGSVWCWGDNLYSQLGVADPAAGSKTALEVTSIGTGFVQITSEYLTTCALRSDGAVWCWGSNDDGELGQGHQNEVLGAVQVPLACP